MRVLIATIPVLGHLAPFIPIAKALIARGHEVRWYSGSKYRDRIQATGAQHIPYRTARDFDDARLDEEIRGRTEREGLAKLKLDLKFFIDAAPGQLADLRAIVEDFAADVVVHDTAMIGVAFLHQQGGPPAGVLGVVPMPSSSVDTAPFGLGIAPSSTLLGRLRNRALNFFVQKVAFRDVQAHWNRTRATLQLPPTGWWMDTVMNETFYLQPSVPSFEYPRRELPSSAHFIGLLPAEQPANPTAPPFWPELDGSRPVVHVTQGTIANTTPDLIAPALEGLAGEDVLVVVAATGRSSRWAWAPCPRTRALRRSCRTRTFCRRPP
jgi:UDP:flavonoid glycosyltransferase YjiC (YdhE family)